MIGDGGFVARARSALDVERFVQLVVAGGLALLAGLWGATLLARGSPGWFASVALALAGCAALGAGIRSELTV